MGLMNQLCLGKLESFTFFGSEINQKCFAYSLPNHSQIMTNSFRGNVNCLIFAHIVNSVRRKVYFDCIKVEKSSSLKLLRADTDCLTFVKMKNLEIDDFLIKNYKKLKYKIELDNILAVYNFFKKILCS
jgi:hypothetical protein